MADLIEGADFLDEISITDVDGNLVNITSLPGFEAWYYIANSTILVYKFSKASPTPTGYLPFIVADAYHYKAYLENTQTKAFKQGALVCDIYVATNNSDLVKGYFINLGTKDLTINIIQKPISSK